MTKIISKLSFQTISNKIENLKYKSVGEIISQYQLNVDPRNKGLIGQLVEKYLGLSNNNFSTPDLGTVEIKTIPIKFKANNIPYAKERMVISKVDFNELITKEFDQNHNIQKINNVLFICYWVNNEQHNIYDYQFLGGFIFSLDQIEPEAKEVFINDYKILKNKCKEEKFDEISSSLTTYLEMCTKGQNSQIRTKFNGVWIKPRGWAIKQKYMNKIIEQNYNPKSGSFQLQETEANHKLFNNLDAVLSEIMEYLKTKNNNEFIYKEDQPNKNKARNADKTAEFLQQFISDNTQDQDIKLVSTNTFRDWLSSRNYLLKSISLNKNNIPKESVSFPIFDPLKIINQNYDEEETFIQKLMKKKFIFLATENIDGKIYLKNIVLHEFSEEELKKAIKVFEETKKVFSNKLVISASKNGTGKTKFSNNLPKSKEHLGFHVRPHGQNRNDTNSLPYCTNVELDFDYESLNDEDKKYIDNIVKNKQYTKCCFWIDKDKISEILNNSNKK